MILFIAQSAKGAANLIVTMMKETQKQKTTLNGQLNLLSLIADCEPAFFCPLHNELDISRARYLLTNLGKAHQLPSLMLMKVTTAASELCSNVIKYAKTGLICAWVSEPSPSGRGLTLTVKVADEGPGIKDIEWALREKTSSSGTLGLGLSGTRRLVSSLSIESPIKGRSYGTIITLQTHCDDR